MSDTRISPRGLWRARWAAVGAAVAVAIGGGGWFITHAATPTAPTTFVAITPCRLLDTRPGSLVGVRSTPYAAGETAVLAARGSNGNCTIPSSAIAISVNLTAVNGTAKSFLTLFPADASQPTSSNLNWKVGQTPVANSATVALSSGGAFKLFNSVGTVDVVIDIVGYHQLPVDPIHLDSTMQAASSSRAFSPIGSHTGLNLTAAEIALNSWTAPRDCLLSNITLRMFGDVTASQFSIQVFRMNTNGAFSGLGGDLVAFDSASVAGAVRTMANISVAAGQRVWVSYQANSGLTFAAGTTVALSMTCI